METVEREVAMSDPKSLSFHVPAPAVRPGGTPDFSDVPISRAGEVRRPEVDTAPAAAEQGEGKSTVPKRIFVFAGFGLVGIVGGILALRATGKFATLGPAPQQWRRFRVAALAIGTMSRPG